MLLKHLYMSFSLVMLLLACNKDKSVGAASIKHKPGIILNGEAEMSLMYLGNTPDPGAKALDLKDGDISAFVTSDWSSRVHQSLIGTYTVTYKASNKAGDVGSAIRQVNVCYMADNLQGVYNSTVYAYNSIYGTVPVTLTLGDKPSQVIINSIIVFPYVIGAFQATATLSGLYHDEISFDCVDKGAHLTGSGTIPFGGKKISFTSTITTSNSSVTFTEDLSRQ